MTDAHNPKLLSDADAAADLAGLPRPDRGAPKYASEANTEELLPTSKQPDALHLADALEKDMQYPLHGKAADMLRALVSERDALAVRVMELEQDARRYRWLRDQATVSHQQRATPSGIEWPTTFTIKTFVNAPESIDAAIDAALASKEQP